MMGYQGDGARPVIEWYTARLVNTYLCAKSAYLFCKGITLVKSSHTNRLKGLRVALHVTLVALRLFLIQSTLNIHPAILIAQQALGTDDHHISMHRLYYRRGASHIPRRRRLR